MLLANSGIFQAALIGSQRDRSAHYDPLRWATECSHLRSGPSSQANGRLVGASMATTRATSSPVVSDRNVARIGDLEVITQPRGIGLEGESARQHKHERKRRRRRKWFSLNFFFFLVVGASVAAYGKQLLPDDNFPTFYEGPVRSVDVRLTPPAPIAAVLIQRESDPGQADLYIALEAKSLLVRRLDISIEIRPPALDNLAASVRFGGQEVEQQVRGTGLIRDLSIPTGLQQWNQRDYYELSRDGYGAVKAFGDSSSSASNVGMRVRLNWHPSDSVFLRQGPHVLGGLTGLSVSSRENTHTHLPFFLQTVVVPKPEDSTSLASSGVNQYPDGAWSRRTTGRVYAERQLDGSKAESEGRGQAAGMPVGQGLQPLSAKGLDSSVQTKESENTLRAGIIMGIGTSALLAAFQTIPLVRLPRLRARWRHGSGPAHREP